ncbi:MAG TPA: tRNA 4-thiouridine(8) synthase ThiI, partial [Bacillaceae bacterium]
MNYDRILIRYGEMSLKGGNRKHFVTKLKKNIKFILRDFPGVQIESGWDRMYVLLNGQPTEPIMDRLQKVFGIQSFSPAIKTDK